MKNEQRLDSILEMVKGLSEHEQSILADKIMQMMTKSNVSKSNMCNTLIEEVSKEKPDCPHCDAKSSLGFINKKGTHKGAQRYYCKSCGKYFVSTTNTAFAFYFCYLLRKIHY